MVVAETIAGVGAFKTMFDMAKALKEMDAANTRNMAVMDLQDRILAAQAAYSTLTHRISELEAQVKSFETWEAEKKRYELRKFPPGILIYRLKPGMENGEPPHEICADCYQKGTKSLLHNLGESEGLTYWKCHTCGFDKSTGHYLAVTCRPE
ncbi:hypothetical protein [Mesorhizobium amorphae]|uniref:Uncharacterized protein n=1 Tax=Mesorhizobium amorphae CCNWGS0123 TaxID=1082933 RepID=G6Y2F2_9HYPH|nr:hypothetical protein [Mesorhizobium amorphae]ANT53446.1 hypothetical protein A6B35_28010 [Mesorhizobium amorphae CCNWGS0123]EHH14135.1 hypothetical protein MEA186_00460 [Mesorhizobium amorphae CCNWGS0123]GLR41369.1 hypothetical protein GCM10007880_18850 [Mesorhizobium amorphae]